MATPAVVVEAAAAAAAPARVTPEAPVPKYWFIASLSGRRTSPVNPKASSSKSGTGVEGQSVGDLLLLLPLLLPPRRLRISRRARMVRAALMTKARKRLKA